jgi:hypothetical protein
MPKGDAEWHTLQKCIDETAPACVGDPRFILDADDIDAAELANVCETCPLLAQCHDYANAARPSAGVWAGKRWRGIKKTKENL